MLAHYPLLVTLQWSADAAVLGTASATIHEAVQYNIQVHILAVVSQLLDDALDLQGKADEACPWCSGLRRSSMSSRPLQETGCTSSATLFLVMIHSEDAGRQFSHVPSPATRQRKLLSLSQCLWQWWSLLGMSQALGCSTTD